MRTVYMLLGVIAFCLLMNPVESFAKEKPVKPKGIRGTLAKVEDGKVVVQCGPDKIKTIQTDDKTLFQVEKTEGKIEDLKEGMHIFVQKDIKTQIALEVHASSTTSKGLGRVNPKPEEKK